MMSVSLASVRYDLRHHHRLVLRAATLLTAGLLMAPIVVTDVAGAAGPVDEDRDLDQTIDPDQDVVTGVAELTTGHVDLGPRYLSGEEGGDADDGTDADGTAERAWTLMIHDDRSYDDDGADPVWRHPDETVLRVHDAGLLPVPDDEAYGFLGVEPGQEVHVVPQTQDPEVVWLGWNTQDPEVMETIDRGVTMSLVGADGPGHLVVYLQSGAFEEPDVLWDSRTDEAQPAWIPVNTHTHANWVFTEPGVHQVHLEVTADLVDGTTVTDTRVLRFAVGDEVTVDEALAAESTLSGTGAAGESDEATETHSGGTDEGGTDEAPTADPEDPQDTLAGDEAGTGMSSTTWSVLALAVALVVAGTLVGFNARRSRKRAFEARDEVSAVATGNVHDRTRGGS